MSKRSISRRRFLRQAVGAAVGAASLPAIVPSSVFGMLAPSERITLGFIGVGKQGTYLLRAFLNEPGTQVLAVCDVDALKLKRARELTDQYYSEQSAAGGAKACKPYRDFRQLLARDDIDAVVIATPDHWHSILVIEAVRAGKDIYCEKPLCQTITEARAMVHEVRRHGRVFQTGSMQRSYSQFRYACELVRNGRIGKVQTVTVDVGGPPVDCDLPTEPVPEYLDWNLWLGPAPWRPYHSELSPHISIDVFPNWRSYRDFGGGGMTDWGAHHFDIAQWGLGMDDSGPVEIIAPGQENNRVLTYKYANGVTMTRDGFEGHGVLFTGTEGKIEVNRSYIRTWPERLAREVIGPEEIRLYRSSNHYADWLTAIRTRSKPICDVDIGRHSVIVCHLGNIAYQLGRKLQWDPVKERFINDPEADRLLSRSMRSPWHL